MAKAKAHGAGEPVATEFCPPDSLKIEADTVALTPELVKLRYDLLVRRGRAWGLQHWRTEHIQTDF
jgi:hypothetical protein